jgi:hypothetical protein
MWKNEVWHWIRKNDEVHDGIVNNKKQGITERCAWAEPSQAPSQAPGKEPS